MTGRTRIETRIETRRNGKDSKKDLKDSRREKNDSKKDSKGLEGLEEIEGTQIKTVKGTRKDWSDLRAP